MLKIRVVSRHQDSVANENKKDEMRWLLSICAGTRKERERETGWERTRLTRLASMQVFRVCTHLLPLTVGFSLSRNGSSFLPHSPPVKKTETRNGGYDRM